MNDTPFKSYTARVAACIEIVIVSTIGGIQHELQADRTFARLNFTLWTKAPLLFVSVSGFFLFFARERYFSVIERTQEYGILRVLGASLSYICWLGIIETLAFVSTAARIALTFLIRLGVKLTFGIPQAGYCV
jgi:hypothetical protein